MSATAPLAVVSPLRPYVVGRAVTDRRRRKKKKERPAPFKVRRAPVPRMRSAMIHAATVLCEEGYSYREAQSLLRAFFLEVTLGRCNGNVTHAAQKLGIARNHLRKFHERGEKLLKA
jgi:DNA-binding NtrC family response regulator